MSNKIITMFTYITIIVHTSGSLGEDFEPEFLGTVDNVTVVEGREAVLSCSVTRLRDFKVGWIKVSNVWRNMLFGFIR